MNSRWLVGLSLLSSAAWAEASQKLTVSKAVEVALATSPRVQGARARLNVAEANQKSVRGRFLPTVHVTDEQQHYDSPFAIVFGPQTFVARDVNANTFVASAQQPLLGLLHISQDYAAQEDATGAAEQQVKVAEAALREEVQTQFLRLFEARATEDIAKASQQQLAEQLGIAKSKLAAGVLTTADVLRLQVAAANARQQEIQAQVQEQVSRVAILTDVGLPPDDSTVDFVEPAELEDAGATTPGLTDALAQASKSRPELASARIELSATQHRSQSRTFDLLPELNLEAGYTHITGQIFAPPSAAFVGLRLDWNIFAWGQDWYSHRAFQAQAVAAEFDTENLRRQVGLDVSAKLSQAHAAGVAVEVAQTAIASAEEAYRVTDALVKAGSATTTDLLDAQAALTQARLNLVRAKYEQAIARVAVQRSVGG
jgi:outer membrane protein